MAKLTGGTVTYAGQGSVQGLPPTPSHVIFVDISFYHAIMNPFQGFAGSCVNLSLLYY